MRVAFSRRCNSLTLWNKTKGELILSLDPDMVFLGFDPDDAGGGNPSDTKADQAVVDKMLDDI
jgi:hypothetical protein